jgi:hypothetical protein
VAGNEDLDGDVSGEEAAWRDLVARFDLPVDTEAADAPWPARENLTETARDRQRTEPDAEGDWDDPGRTSPGGRPGPASLPTRPSGGLWPEPADEPGPDAPPGPGTAGADPDDSPAADAASATGATSATSAPGVNGASLTGTQPAGASPDGTDQGSTDQDGTGADGTGSAGANGHRRTRPDRPRIIRRAGPGRPDQVAGEPDELDEDDRYVPPPPEPLPPLDPVAKGAWAGVLGGPAYLLIARLADWQIPDWAALAAIVAFVAGFATLVVRMGDKPRDDDDDGAVV